MITFDIIKDLKMEFNDFVLLFQGPLHKNFLYGLMNNYKTYTDNIVVSHWSNDNPELIEYLNECGIVKKNNIITNEIPTYSPNTFNNQNIFYQTHTTLNGLKSIDYKIKSLQMDAKFVIKLRTDQWFGNLIPMFEAVRNNPTKYNCVNLHFRPRRILKYHPSDKMIGMTIDNMLETFYDVNYRLTHNALPIMAGAYMYTDDTTILPLNTIRDYIGNYSYNDPNRKLNTIYGEKPLIGCPQILPGGYIGLVSEIIIGTSFLFINKILPDPDNDIEIINKYFNIVKVEDMLPYMNKQGNNTIEHHHGAEIFYINEYDK